MAAIVGNDQTVVTRREGPPRDAEEPGLGRRRLGDLHVRIDRDAEGRRGEPPQRGGVRGRRVADVPAARCRSGDGDRVMAGLSVAFDASCEEMWLAWRYGACLVPAPRALVKSGIDVGPWLVGERRHRRLHRPDPGRAVADRSRWPGSGCSSWAARRARPSWPPGWWRPAARSGTPTARPRPPSWRAVPQLTGGGPVRIGLPLDGWDLAVVDGRGQPVAEGATGELIIGGVGLARYLDPVKDAEKYAPMPSLGWDRAYRSGDLVVNDPEGLVFGGRADDQVKLGGRRIELGEIDSALLAVPGVVGAAAAVRRTGRRQPAPRRLRRHGRGVRPCAGDGAAPPLDAGRAGAPARGGRRAAHEDVRQGRPGRAALAAPGPGRGPRVTWPDGDDGLDRRALARGARRRRPRPGRRLLRPRRRQPHRGAAGVTTAHEVPRGRGRRPLRAPERGHARGVPRPAHRRGPRLRPHGAADSAEVPGRTGSGDDAAPVSCRAALAGLGAASAAGCSPTCSAGRCCRSRAGGCWASAGWSSSPRPARCCSPRRAPGCSCVRYARETTRAAARCTCGCGWPSAWWPSSAPPGWPGRRT